MEKRRSLMDNCTRCKCSLDGSITHEVDLIEGEKLKRLFLCPVCFISFGSWLKSAFTYAD